MATASPSAAAERMRRHRERRRKGLRCLRVELRETEIDALIRKRLLKPDMRHDPTAIRLAFYEFLDRTLPYAEPATDSMRHALGFPSVAS